MPGYTVEWDGSVVTLPAVEPPRSPDYREGFIQDTDTAAGLPNGASAVTRRGVPVVVHLIPRPDNSYNEWAVSICAPQDGRSSVQERHLGYLFDDYLAQLGEQTLHRVARYSDGEIRCTAYISARRGELNALALPMPVDLRRALNEFLSHPSTPSLDIRPTLHDLIGLKPHGETMTHEALDHLSTFANPARPVGHVSATTLQNARGRPSSLAIRDEITGRYLGEVALGLLFLNDERDRPAVLDHVAELGVHVAQPVEPHRAATRGGTAWPANEVPNMWTYWFVEGLDFRARNPKHPWSQTSIAQYNPTTKTLYVEDEPLVAPTCVYAARVGIKVSDVRVPKRRWQLEREFLYRERRDVDLRPENYRDTVVKPEVWKLLRHTLPDGIIGDDDVSWKPGTPGRDDCPIPASDEFAMHEALVRERSTLFRQHEVTGRFAGCRLCGKPGTEFTTPGCSGPLAYCHVCLGNAHHGVFGSFDQASAALRFLSEQEHSNGAPLEHQLASLQLDEASPASPAGVDALIMARYAMRRRRWPWTRLLASAGLLGDGLRMARGTVMEAVDGHLCLSMQEKAVDDFFHQHEIRHDREPLYPFDAELNPHARRRADWLLADGTLVEMWGLDNDPAYATKRGEKEALAARNGINLVGLTLADTPRLPAIFERWLTEGATTEASWSPPQRKAPKKRDKGDGRGGNPRNTQQREDRIARCKEAVEYQQAGFSRQEIAETLGVAAETVKILLRDGKFYANPHSDQLRAEVANAAADARQRGLTKRQFQAERTLTTPKVNEAWKDADVLHAGQIS